MVAEHTTEMLSNLSKKDRELVVRLIEKMHENNELVSGVCMYLSNQVGDHKLDDFLSMDLEMRIQACTEYIIIALASGDISRRELEKMFL